MIPKTSALGNASRSLVRQRDVGSWPRSSAARTSLNAFAGHTHGDTWDRSEFRYRLASIFVRTVPFATTQERTDELPPAVVAMDTIAAMEGHRELATPPAFVNVIGNWPRHTRGARLRQACARGDQTSELDACNGRKLRYEPFSMSGNAGGLNGSTQHTLEVCLQAPNS